MNSKIARKPLVAFIVILLVSLLLSGCAGQPFTCFLCGQEKSGKRHESELFGSDIVMCDECYNGVNDLVNGPGN